MREPSTIIQKEATDGLVINRSGPGLFDSVDRVLAQILKGLGFDSGLEHVPCLQP